MTALEVVQPVEVCPMTDLDVIQAVEVRWMTDLEAVGMWRSVGLTELHTLSTDMRGFSALYVGRSRKKAFFGFAS